MDGVFCVDALVNEKGVLEGLDAGKQLTDFFIFKHVFQSRIISDVSDGYFSTLSFANEMNDLSKFDVMK